jgi:PAS domain S-box-containing protein
MFNVKDIKEFISLGPWDISPELQPDGQRSDKKAEEMIKIAMDEGSNYFEWEHKKLNGSAFPATVLLTRVDLESESFLQATVRDITDQKKEEKLQSVLYGISQAVNTTDNLDELYQAIHNHLTKVIDTTNFFIALLDEEKNMMSFPYFVDEFDDPPDPVELTDKTISEHVIQTGKPLYFRENNIRELIDKGVIDQDYAGTVSKVWLGAPLRIKNKSTGVIVVQSYHDPDLYSESDLEILTFVSEQIAQTIEYKQSITDLEVEKTYLDELFTNSPEAVALVDNESLILKINPEFTSLFGYAEEEIVGKNIDGLLTDREQLKNAEKLTYEVRTGRRVFVEAIRRKKDGTMLQVSILGAPIKYKGGVLAVYAIYRDISERKEAEAQLKSSERKHRLLSKQLTESNMMKETLLDIISHDLKNPAGVIQGFSELLQEENGDNEIVTGIMDSSKSLIKVIDNVSTLSKVTLGEKIRLKSLDLVRVIEQVSDEYKSQFASKGMKLYLNLPDSLQVQANPIIAEIFKNYLSNALKYSSDGKKVIIDTAIDENSITIHFIDFGPTVPKKKREIIFERGSQLEKGAKRGRGLGLAIAKRIADAHNGHVWVEPNEPTGNRFCLRLPLYV